VLGIPWAYFAAVTAVAVGATALTAAGGVRASRDPSLTAIRDL
jgi:hypothetical protein